MSTTPAAERAALDGPAVLAKARGLEKLLREEADEVEQRRQLTPRVVDALRTSGVFRMAMPASWGGPEIDILTQVEILEAVSRADGSAGWCAMIGSDGGFYSASLDDAAGRELYPDVDGVTAGWIYPVGRLDVWEGGYRLSGRWSFGSGCTHADVLVGGALVDLHLPHLPARPAPAGPRHHEPAHHRPEPDARIRRRPVVRRGTPDPLALIRPFYYCQ